MNCYQTLAAATVIANTADVLYAAPEAVKARLLFELGQGRPQVPNAA